jgi:hypothetical protein
MSGAAKDYDFGRKNGWRRWAWNRIAERLPVPAREAVVLYLAAPSDLDRIEAVRRGVRPDNLIAIERDKSALQSLRRRGVLCIDGELVDVLNSWTRLEVHAVVADMCGGLDIRFAHGFANWFNYRDPFKPAVWAMNFLRGRDASSSNVRETLRDPRDENPFAKHRGMLMLHAAWEQFQVAQGLRSADGLCHDQEVSMRVADWFMRETRPAFNSYASGRLRFDSVVLGPAYLRVPANQAHDDAAERKRTAGSAAKRIAAVLAHRTRRAA